MKSIKTKPKPKPKEKEEQNAKNKSFKDQIEANLITASELKKDNYMKALIYGAPGCGKSHLSIATQLKTIVICTEYKQTVVTYNHVEDMGKLNPKTVLYEANSMKKLRNIIKYLRTENHGYKLVVLDHIGKLQKIIKKYFIRLGKSRTLEIPNQAEWQALIEKTLDVIEAFRDLPNTHFLALGHTNDFITEKTRIIKPKIQGKSLDSDIAGAMNLVGYMVKEVTEDSVDRDVLFLTDNDIVTKDHYRLNEIEPADLDYWIAKWKGDIDVSVSYEEWLNM